MTKVTDYGDKRRYEKLEEKIEGKKEKEVALNLRSQLKTSSEVQVRCLVKIMRFNYTTTDRVNRYKVNHIMLGSTDGPPDRDGLNCPYLHLRLFKLLRHVPSNTYLQVIE